MNTLPTDPFNDRPPVGVDYGFERESRRHSRDDYRRNRRPIKPPDDYYGEGDKTWMTWEEYLTHFNLFSDWNG